MKFKPLYLFIPIFGFFTACAQVPISPESVEQQVDLWLQQQQYDKALDALVKVFPKHSDPRRIERLHKDVSGMALIYEKKTVQQADKLIAQGKWADALTLYDNASKNYSKGSTLKKGLNKLHNIQTKRLNELEIDILINHAEWLENILVMYTAMAETSPRNRSAQRTLKKKRQELTKVSAQLTELGIKALKQGNIKTAEQLIPMAMRMDPNARSERAYKALRKVSTPKSATKTRKNGTAKKKQHRSKKIFTAKELHRKFDEAYRKHNLANAQQILSQLEGIENGTPRLTELRHRLDQDISITIDREMNMGISQYSRGEPEQAIASWQNVLQLDPDNELAQTHIQRAKRILDKLRQIRNKQPSN